MPVNVQLYPPGTPAGSGLGEYAWLSPNAVHTSTVYTPAGLAVLRAAKGNSLGQASQATHGRVVNADKRSVPSVAVAASSPAASVARASGSGVMKDAPMQKDVRQRIKNLEQRLSAKVVEDPMEAAARKEALRALRLIACPDELNRVQGKIPIIPSKSTSARFPLVSSVATGQNLDNFNMVVSLPGQTSYALVTTTPGYESSLIAVNIARSDFAWTLDQVGLSAFPGTANWNTRRLVPQYALGYIATCTNERPAAPTVVTTAASSTSVRYVITDGAGNYMSLSQQVAPGTMFTVIGRCAYTHAGSQSTTAPIGVLSNNTVAGSTITITGLAPQTGKPLRSLLMIEGASGGRTGPDLDPSPYLTAATNIRLQSLAGAMYSKYSAFNYSVVGGREGPYCNPVPFTSTLATPVIAVPSLTAFAGRSRQHVMGVVNPDNDQWYGVNIAARLNGLEDRESRIINDFSYNGIDDAFQAQVSQSAATVQGDAINAYVPSNLPGVGWDDSFVGSITWIESANSQVGFIYTAVAVPFTLEAYSWLEFGISSEIGLPLAFAAYYAEMNLWLQELSRFPTLACADSFKDFFSSVWKKGKAAAIDLTRRATKVGKEFLREEAAQALMALLSTIVV